MAGFISEIVADITDELQYVAPMQFTIKDRNWNEDPPKYYVYPRSIQSAMPMGPGRSSNPRILHKDTHSLEFHCYGRDLPETERLRQALVTAVRKVVQGHSYELGSSSWIDTPNLQLGYVLVCPIDIWLALPEADLPTVGTPPQPVGDLTNPEVKITDVGPDDSETPPAGTMQW